MSPVSIITQLSVKNVRIFNSDLFEFELRPADRLQRDEQLW